MRWEGFISHLTWQQMPPDAMKCNTETSRRQTCRKELERRNKEAGQLASICISGQCFGHSAPASSTTPGWASGTLFFSLFRLRVSCSSSDRRLDRESVLMQFTPHMCTTHPRTNRRIQPVTAVEYRYSHSCSEPSPALCCRSLPEIPR